MDNTIRQRTRIIIFVSWRPFSHWFPIQGLQLVLLQFLQEIILDLTKYLNSFTSIAAECVSHGYNKTREDVDPTNQFDQTVKKQTVPRMPRCARRTAGMEALKPIEICQVYTLCT